MPRALTLAIRVTAAINCNYLVYILKRLPWLGKKIPDTFYRAPTTKAILSVLAELFRFLFGFAGAALTLAVLLLIPMFVMDQGLLNMDLFYHYFFFIFFLATPLGTNIIFQTQDMNAYTMINILNLDKRDFLVSRVAYTLGIKTFRYMVLLVFSGLFMAVPPLVSLMLSGYILFAALIWEATILEIFGRFRFNPYDRPGYTLLSLFLLLAICYLLPYLGLTLKLRPFLESGYLFALLLILAALSLWRLYSFNDYRAVTKKTINRERLLGVADLLKNAAFADVNLKEERLSRERVTGTGDLQGYALLNHLFFARHRGIMVKPVRIKVVILAVLAIPLWVLLLLKPEFQEPARGYLLASSPYLVFVMYLLSSGDKFSRALFFNCDRYMLREHYYREKKALLDNFTVRLKRSIRLNLPPAAAVAVLLLGTGVIVGMGGATIRLLPIVVTVFSLSLFFSTHFLFSYYMLQPYTVDLTRKSPLYGLIHVLIYLISYGSIYIKTSSIFFTLAVILFTLAYTGTAVLLTYHLAPRTFKLR